MSRARRSPRTLLKAAAERALSIPAARARRTQAQRGAAVILAYHNVVEPASVGRGDVSLHLAIGDFLEQMERLGRTHRIVPLRELVGGPEPGSRPRAAVTFDDAYRGALRLALPALAEAAIPCTVFVPPGLLGRRGFWWDLLSRSDGGLPDDVRERVLSRERGRPEVATAELRRGLGPDLEVGTLDELREAVALPGVDAASHTWSHPNLTALSDAELAEELGRSRAWLREELTDAAADHLSFPYGLWDERVVAAARDAGYRFLYRVDGGIADVLPSEEQPIVLPRVNIPAGVSARGFDLRAAGLLQKAT